MLVVKQIEPKKPEELAYECYDNGSMVGHLTARLIPNAYLEAELGAISHNEAARSLIAKLERDAKPHGIRGIYLYVSTVRERQQFESAGYHVLDDLKLLKTFN